jgi:DNA-binding transcriptional MerR regulator
MDGGDIESRAWPIAVVARDAGVTARTLRHYDAIGLLRPAFTDAAGMRHYRRDELLRLQRILLLRSLGMPLPAIAAVLDETTDARAALEQHRAWLAAERDRLGRLLATVEHTLTALEEGTDMAPQAMFDGFEANPYEDEARRRWGDEAVDGARDRMRSWTPDDAELARTGYARVHQGLAELKRQGAAPDDRRVQDLVDLHYETTCRFWTPTADAYRGLGEMYVQDERFRRSIGEDVVGYLRDAMAVYAGRELE